MEWFVGLPVVVQIISVVLFLVLLFVLLLVLAYIGKVTLKFGKNVITFGKQVKRTCGDCILLILGKRERLDSQRNFILNRVLKDQMNFAEQKLLDVQSMFLSSYRDQLFKNRNENTSPSEENKQYRLYQGILSNAQMAIKDEVRRSFKENGFEHLSGAEFTNYVKTKSSTLIAIGKDHIDDLYPFDGMIVPMEERGKVVDQLAGKLEDICFEIYTKARTIKIDAKKKVEALEKEFAKEIDEFIQVRQ